MDISLSVASPELKISKAAELVIEIVGKEGVEVGCLTAVEQIRSR